MLRSLSVTQRMSGCLRRRLGDERRVDLCRRCANGLAVAVRIEVERVVRGGRRRRREAVEHHRVVACAVVGGVLVRRRELVDLEVLVEEQRAFEEQIAARSTSSTFCFLRGGRSA